MTSLLFRHMLPFSRTSAYGGGVKPPTDSEPSACLDALCDVSLGKE